MDYGEFIEELKKSSSYQGQIAHVEVIPPRDPEFQPLPSHLHPKLKEALGRKGIVALYPHQVKAIAAVREGKNVIIASGTSSGKSLCYHLPVIDAVLKDPSSRALYLFPTKALAQDQLRSLFDFGIKELVASTYDGDTPPDLRGWVRKNSHIVLSNPDMLHVGILPNHRLWSRFLAHLHYVVLDEAHVTRGVFGSHTAMVLRRLRRLCAYYGSSPIFILTTATIGNPREHAEALTGLEVAPVVEDSSPRGEKIFLLWNPAMEGEDGEARRKSSQAEATQLLLRLIERGVRTIVFTRSRKSSELIYNLARRALIRSGEKRLAERIASYRGGYLPEERRGIERELFAGNLLAVISTNALELGIDIGELEACLMSGYPGTLSSTWQQAGRAGRRKGQSLAVLVGKDDPLDQYLMRNPEALFGKPCEEAIIDLKSPSILAFHLLCAAHELPLTADDDQFFGTGSFSAAEELFEEGLLKKARGRLYMPGENPAPTLNLRSASNRVYRIIDAATGSLLGTVDEGNAFFHIHPGAIYLHQGDPYEVKTLDLEKKVALVEEAEEEYYTQPRDVTDVRILEELQSSGSIDLGHCSIHYGEVEVVTQVYAYQLRHILTHQVIESRELDLPPVVLRTRALWYLLPRAMVESLNLDGTQLAGGLHAVEHAAIALLPLYAMCDRWDIGGVSTSFHRDTGEATIFIYDAYAGGAGIALKGFELWRKHLEGTLHLVSDCACSEGCPSCIQSPKCGSGNEPLNKEAAIKILALLREDLERPDLPPRGEGRKAELRAGSRGDCVNRSQMRG